jgi:hypothetical protein
MKTTVFRKVLGGLSLTTALFVFQACYGTGMDYMTDVLIEGQVRAKTSELPIPGIKVSVPESGHYTMSDDKGRFSFFSMWRDSLTLRFEDVDSTQNGQYMSRDTIFRVDRENVFLVVDLEKK